jgi:tRNA (guanine37-N1)-methyltransferase
MRFDVLTLFPEMVTAAAQSSILRRAQESGTIEVVVHDIRAAATDTHRSVDDTPYGGGVGMVLRVDIIDRALQSVPVTSDRCLKIMLCPQGERLQQPRVEQLSQEYDQIILLCGHYEGFDERIRSLVDLELSVGDFVLTGGELPALMVVDAVSRLRPGVIHEDSPQEESFSMRDTDGTPLLEYPHYTRPVDYQGSGIPEVLLSGNHAAIAAWRLEQARARTAKRKVA